MDINEITTWQIVKWTLIVLVAAFIGQFGKTFAQYLMSRFRSKKVRESSTVPPAKERQSQETEKQQIDEVALKARKKEAKTQLKAKKKEDKNKNR